MKLLITGADGQLGLEFQRQWPQGAVGRTRAQLDITNRPAVLQAVRAEQPQVIVNCAAYTAVDRAEADEEACFRINAAAVAHLVDAADSVRGRLVQISTDYVFGGRQDASVPHSEGDLPEPHGVYARSKLCGERLALQYDRSLVVRTCGLYGHSPRRNNFVEAIRRLAARQPVLRVVNDQVCNPTSAASFVHNVLHLLRSDVCGLIHVVDEPPLSWYEFARAIVREAGLQVDVEPITSDQFGAPAPRPRYSVLDTSRLRSLGGRPASVVAALAEYLGARP